jgi:TetR/AcrR family transcriptional regulator, transcriptional repressor of aconitase
VPRVEEAYLASRRRLIMDAAIACFSREGFHRTTMQEIVRETGLSAGAIYRYYRSKEDIVAAIAEEHHAPEASVLEDAATTDDVGATLRQLVQASLGRLTDPDERRWRRVTIQVWAEALRDERIMAVVRGGLDEPVRILAELITRGQREGTLPNGIDPNSAARVCASIFQGLVLQQAWDPDLDVEGYIDAVLVILDGLTVAN